MPTPEQIIVSLCENGADVQYTQSLIALLRRIITEVKKDNNDFGKIETLERNKSNFNPFQTQLILQSMRGIAANRRSNVGQNLCDYGCTPDVIWNVELEYRQK